MDTTRLLKRFKSLVDFAVSTGATVDKPIITHSLRGEMDIFDVLAFEFHTDVPAVKAALRDVLAHEQDNMRYSYAKVLNVKHLTATHIEVLIEDDLAKGLWKPGQLHRSLQRGLAPTRRQAQITGFVVASHQWWTPSVSVVIANNLLEWLVSDETYMELGGINVLKQTGALGTRWVAHEPQQFPVHEVHLPIYPGAEEGASAPKVNVAGMEEYFAAIARNEAEGKYHQRYSDYIEEGDRITEEARVQKEWDKLTSHPQSVFPGEEAANA